MCAHRDAAARTVGRFENGPVPPTLDKLSAIARAIGVPLRRLLRDG
ncbi:helix-turn-helix domain-containing protein [Kitasatospora sp. NPDC086801]